MNVIAEAQRQLDTLGASAPALAPYQQQPPQMPAGMPGKYGYLSLCFTHDGQRSVLKNMTHRAPFLVQRPLYWDEQMPHMPCIFLITTSGGMLQGDRFALNIHLSPHTCAHITTQSATKIHSMTHNYAAQIQQITLEENSYLEMLPEPIIPHNSSRFVSKTQIQRHPSSTLLFSEILASGRKYHPSDGGFNFDIYENHTEAKDLHDRPLFSEHYVLQPRQQPLSGAGIMGGFHAAGSVILLTPEKYHQAMLSRLPPLYDAEAGIIFGTNLLPNHCGLIFKAVGTETHQVKSAIHAFWQAARETITGTRAPDPFLWR